MGAIEITDSKTFHEALSGHEQFILYCYATWCGFCHKMRPSIEEAGRDEEFANIPVYMVDYGGKEDVASEIIDKTGRECEAYPTTYVYRKGKLFGFCEGAFYPYENLKPWIEEFVTAFKIVDSVDQAGTSGISSPQSNASEITPIPEISNPEELTQTLSSEKAVVIHCYYSGDAISKAMSLAHERVATMPEYVETTQFCRVNFAQEEVLQAMKAAEIEVESQETLVLKKGKVVARMGQGSMDEFQSWLKGNVGSLKGMKVGHASSTIIAGGVTRRTPARENSTPVIITPLENSMEQVQIVTVNSNHLGGDLKSTDSVASTISVLSTTHSACKGVFEDREKRGFIQRVLTPEPEPFLDPDRDCLGTLTRREEGLQIGSANDEGSCFTLTVSHTPPTQPGELRKLIFGVEFMPDVTKRARFSSATFRVTFERYVNDKSRVPLKIRDIWPTNETGPESETMIGEGWAGSGGLTVGMSNAASLSTSLGKQRSALYTIKGSSQVRGTGVHTSTAKWTFTEDREKGGKKGLDTYPLHVMLPPEDTDIIWIKFWAKAMLVTASGKEIALQLGTEKEQYERTLNLTALYD